MRVRAGRVCRACEGTGTSQGERCNACFGTGYKGRLAVYEVMEINDEIRHLTANRADGVSIAESAKRHGFEPMDVDAMRKVKTGVTTMEELERVLR